MISNTGKIHKAGVFRWVTNIHEHKRYYYTFDNSLLFTEGLHHTNLSTLNHNVRLSSVSAPGRWHNAIRVRAKPCVTVLIIPGHSRREVFHKMWTIIRVDNDDSSHLTYINKY